MTRTVSGHHRSRSPLHPPALVALLSLALICLVLPATLPAQQQGGGIDIEVEDMGGKGIADVKVTVLSTSGDVLLEGTTNKKGKFKGSVEASGTHVLKLEKTGFGPVERQIELTGGVTMSGTLKMLDEEQYRRTKAVDAFNAGVAAIQGGDSETALARFGEAAEWDPSIADAHRMVAAISLEKNDVDGASSALERYLDLKGLDPAVAPVAYEVFRLRADPRKDEAIAILKSTGGPAAEDAARRVFNAGVAANRSDDRDGAIAAWTDAVEIDPTLSPAYRSLAALAFNDQDYAAALQYVEQLLTIAPELKEGLRMGFWCHAFLGHTDDATAMGKRWAAEDGDAPKEILAEAERLFEENQTAEARNMAQILVAVAPDYPRGHYALGRIEAGSGNVAEAKKHLQHFLDLAPADPEADAARQMLAGL